MKTTLKTTLKTISVILITAALAAPTMALSFSEDFNDYTSGSTDWYSNGSSGPWTMPTTDLKLDGYTFDGLAPRTGNSGDRAAYAEVDETSGARIEFSAEFFWDHAKCKSDGFFVVLAEDPATADMVPDNGSLGSPINAIAWGHAGTGGKDYGFFDGQSWTVVGWSTTAAGTDNSEVVSGYIETDGSWHAESTGGGSGVGTLAIGDFRFDTISIQSRGNNSGYFSGIDNITVATQGGTLPGDLNGDGAVNSADLDIVRSYWGQTVTTGDLLMGDASGDGLVGSADLDIVRANWGMTASAASVIPEPAAICLLACGSVLCLLRRRR